MAILYAVLALAGIGLIAGLAVLYNSDLLRVREIRVEGEKNLSEARVRELANVRHDATLPRVDPGAIERRLEENPWVSKAHVRRDYPSALEITIEERRPIALVAVGKAHWVLAEDRTWLRNASAGTTKPAPMIVAGVPGLKPRKGERTDSRELANAIAVIRGLSPGLRRQVKSLVAAEVDTTALITKSDVEIVIGRAGDMPRKDRVVLRILAEQAGRVVFINVRTIDRPTWRGLNTQP